MKEESKHSRWRSVLLALVLSPIVFGLVGGLIGAALMLVSYLYDPSSVTVGSGPDPWGVSALAFVSFGFAGTLAGAVIGTVAAIVIAIRGYGR